MDLSDWTAVITPMPRYIGYVTTYMNITISGTHIDLTDALQNRVREQFARLEKILDPNARVMVEIGKTTDHHKNGNVFKAEGKIIEPKAEYFADIITTDLYMSIDSLSDELFNQITQSKRRHRVLLKRGSAAIKKLLRLS